MISLTFEHDRSPGLEEALPLAYVSSSTVLEKSSARRKDNGSSAHGVAGAGEQADRMRLLRQPQC